MSRTLLEVANPRFGSLKAKDFVWSQNFSTSAPVALHLRWSTTEPAAIAAIGASWQVWALNEASASQKTATVVAKGSVTGKTGEFEILPNAFLSNQPPSKMTMYLVQLTVLGRGDKPIGLPSNFVRVAQYPQPSSPPGTYLSWEGTGDDSREPGHPIARFISYQPPADNRDGSVTLLFVNTAATASHPVYVEISDSHGFVGRSQEMPTIPALAKGETKEVTLQVAYLRGAPQQDATLSLKVYTRKVTAATAIDPWEQPQAKPSYEGRVTSCDGQGCAQQNVHARFEGYRPPTKNGLGALIVVFFNESQTPTLPVTAFTADMNKHVVMAGVGGFPIPALKQGQMYRVDFSLRPTEPNGVPAAPLDMQVVTGSIQPHVFTGLGHICAGTGCARAAFDLEANGHDDNGLLVNPFWHYQLHTDLLDPAVECQHLGDQGNPFPNCSTQMTYWQNMDWGGPGASCGSWYGLGDGHFNYFPATITGRITAHACTGPDGDVCWDLRPGVVGVLPADSFKVFSESDVKQVLPGIHSGAFTAQIQWHLEMNSSATTDRFGSKFWTHYRDIANSDAFTKDASPASCPKGFSATSGDCQSGSTCIATFVEDDSLLGNTCVKPVESDSVVSNEAIATGLVGLDCMHGCEEELHPIYVLAIHMKDDPDDDVWAIVVNNAGEQGACGHKVIGAHLGDKKPFRLRLWRPTAFRKKGMVITSVVEAAGTELRHPKGGQEKRTTVSLDEQDAIIEFSLPTPTADVMVSQFSEQEFSGQGGDDASGFIEGELHMKWTARVAASPHVGGSPVSGASGPAPSSHESAIPLPFRGEAIKLQASPARHFNADNDEDVFPLLLKQVPVERRALLLSRSTKSRRTVDPPLVETLVANSTPSATPPVRATDPPLEWHRSAGPKGELFRDMEKIRALCEAFDGNIPHSPPSTCPKVK
jgi:hypothetical protein